jgi:hypothetical protein
MADLPIAAVVRIAKKNGAERVGSDAAAALVAKAEAYIATLTSTPEGRPSRKRMWISRPSPHKSILFHRALFYSSHPSGQDRQVSHGREIE